MAYEQCIGASTMQWGSEEDVSHKQKWNSVSQLQENTKGSYDCSICLESCNEPVVTLCGHHYCWPCIYEWLHVQSSSFEPDEQPRCPVCKAFISSSALVLLYGRDRSPSEYEAKKRQLELTIPARPPALELNTLLATSASNSNLQNSRNTFDDSFSSYSSMLGSSNSTSSFSPTINMVTEIVFAGMFGSSETNMFPYPYPNSYSPLGNGSPRLRRHEIQKSLNRLSIFLFCCITLCLILF